MERKSPKVPFAPQTLQYRRRGIRVEKILKSEAATYWPRLPATMAFGLNSPKNSEEEK